MREVKVNVEKELLDKAKELMPELRGLTYTGVTDYLLRKALKEIESERAKIKGEQNE